MGEPISILDFQQNFSTCFTIDISPLTPQTDNQDKTKLSRRLNFIVYLITIIFIAIRLGPKKNNAKK